MRRRKRRRRRRRRKENGRRRRKERRGEQQEEEEEEEEGEEEGEEEEVALMKGENGDDAKESRLALLWILNTHCIIPKWVYLIYDGNRKILVTIGSLSLRSWFM